MTVHPLKRLTACSIAVLLFVSSLGGSAAGATVLCSVTPSPTAASTPAEYTIRISGNPVDRADQLRIKFPFDTQYTSASFLPSMVTVNGIVSRGGQIRKLSTTNQIQMDIMLAERLKSGTPLTIVVSRDAGIINPLSPRSCYRLLVGFVRDGFEVTTVESDLYAITPSAISAVNATVEPPIASAAAEYVVSFITGSNGRLQAGKDSVTIAFSEGFSLPSSFTLAGITLNGIACDGKVFRDDSAPNAMLVYVPIDAPAGSLITVRIPPKAGIKNPPVAGTGKVTVHTTAETLPVDSAAITIRGREVSDLSVELGTPVSDSSTSVRLTFSLSAVGRLMQGQYMHVRLPVGYATPAVPTGATVGINGTATVVTAADGVLNVMVPAYLPDIADVELTLPVSLGLVNPAVPGGYGWTLWTDGDTAPVVAIGTVRAPSVTSAALASTTRAIGREAGWTITLVPSTPVRFPMPGESVTITFDDTVLVPAQLGQGDVMLNGVDATAVVQGTTLTLTVPQSVQPADTLTVIIDAACGIRTPAVPGTVRAQVATTRDPTPATTNEVEFRVLPVVTVLVSPDAPNGLAECYIGTRPTVQLVSDNATLFYRLDGGTWIVYAGTVPVTIPEGRHILGAYAVASDGTEGEVIERAFVVDLTRPVMTIDGFTGDILARAPELTIRGTVSEPVELVQINGIPAQVTADGAFTVNITVSDGQALACFTRDLAGNASSFVRTVHVDSVAPVITQIGPSVAQQTVHASELDVRVTVNEPATLTVNGVPMQAAGSEYAGTVSLDKGMNTITIRAVDRAGNEGVLTWTVTRTEILTIRLTAGVTTATVGDTEQALDAPPVIVNGVTFVPLRFIGEALGANVGWNDALRIVSLTRAGSYVQLSIGSKLAIIDGRIVELIEAPRITNGRTMVPLRFISEAFGADVVWDQETKSVTVAMPDAA